MIEISDKQRRARLATRHHLAPWAREQSAFGISNSLVALHASDPVTIFLSVVMRQPRPELADVETMLYSDRSVLRHHAMRRTLWVMPVETAAEAHAASSRKIVAAERRRLIKDTMWTEDSIDAGIAEIVEIIESRGMATTREIGASSSDQLTRRIVLGPATAQPTGTSSHTRLLLVAAFEAKIARGKPTGSWISSGYRWSTMHDWIGRSIDNQEMRPAAAALVSKWLRAFGPGTETDLRWWTGWTATQTRTALTDLGAREVRLENGNTGWVHPDDTAAAETHEPWVALLPGLDPTAMGWKERQWYLDDDVAHRVMDRNGNIGPTIWVDGRVVGGWAQRSNGEIATELTSPISETHQRLLDDEISRITDVVGPTRFRVRFPSRNQSDLLG